MKVISDILPFSKNVIVRVDWNVPIQFGKILDNSRIVETIPTLMKLLSAKKHITILTHLGRPNGIYNSELSLKILFPEIESLFGQKIQFIDKLENLGKQWASSISLFENVRFWPEEEKNDSEFAKTLSAGADAFVNDAFSVSHRAHASVEGITHYLQPCVGLLMEHELNYLKHFHDRYQQHLMAICGGAKILTKIAFIQNMIKKAKVIALVGGIANTFLKAKGLNIGQSLVENEALDLAKEIMHEAEKEGCQLWMPNYVRVGKSLKDLPVDKHVSEILPDERILDMAPRSWECLINRCKNAETIIWNGALGVFEYPQWSEGTFTLARELGRLTQTSEIQTLVGGGETVMALRQTNTFNQFSYVSLAGGAFMEFMEGRELPGVAPLL